MRKIGNPLVANLLRDPVCQKRVAMQQETTLGDTVCLIVKFLRHHLVEIFQLLIFQNLGVKFCHTVDGISGYDRQMRHLDLTVKDDRHLFNFLIVIRVLILYLDQKTAVDLFHNLVYTRKQAGEQLDRPFFQCLCHDSVVGVCTTFCCDTPRLIPV